MHQTSQGLLEHATVRYGYTANGMRSSLQDANGNVTGYAYDGFDRLVRTTYPKPGSTLDYDDLTFGTSGATINLVTQRRLRNGSVMTYQYDALARLKTVTPPSPAPTPQDVAVSYAYDNLGRVTAVSDPRGGHNVAMG